LQSFVKFLRQNNYLALNFLTIEKNELHSKLFFAETLISCC
jgi:hypothetical protein